MVKNIHYYSGNSRRERATHTYIHGEPMRRKSVAPSDSVYYWWYEFLKRNEDYKRCCERRGRGKLAALYRDFGDVHSLSFYEWFFEHEFGVRLFAEPPRKVQLEELTSPADWNKEWENSEVIVVVVPLTEPRRRLYRWFGRLLDERHHGRRGYATKVCEARYPIERKFSTVALRQMLRVYDHWMTNQRKTLAEIGEDLKLLDSAIWKKGESDELKAKKRNTMAATVGRYLRKAKAYIRNTANGKFPCSD